jgi:hypothetical protein
MARLGALLSGATYDLIPREPETLHRDFLGPLSHDGALSPCDSTHLCSISFRESIILFGLYLPFGDKRITYAISRHYNFRLWQ